MCRGETATAAAATLGAKFAPVRRAWTATVRAPCDATRAEKPNDRGAPLTSASASQHKRPRAATAPGARTTRSTGGTVTHTEGIPPGIRLITPIVTTNPTTWPGLADA